MAMANELPPLEERSDIAGSTGTTQLLERAFLLLLFAGLLFGILAVLRPFGTGILFGAILAIAAWPLRASDAGGGSPAGLLRQRPADPFLARRPAGCRRAPRQHVGQGAAC